MTAGFRREIVDQKDHEQPADRWHQDDEWSPRARGRELIGVEGDRKLAEERDIMDECDQGAEEDGADPADDADDDG